MYTLVNIHVALQSNLPNNILPFPELTEPTSTNSFPYLNNNIYNQNLPELTRILSAWYSYVGE